MAVSIPALSQKLARKNAAPAVEPVARKVPQHLAIIMDGNGRWAKSRKLPRVAGHKAGTDNLRRILKACVNEGIKILTLYAFSTENWSRPQDEVGGLMNILETVIDRELDELNDSGVQIRHIGRIDRVPENLQEKIHYAINRTAKNDRIILNVALDYGGRADIVQAVRQLLADGSTAEQITEEAISRHLYTGDLPDPDLIVRTSGEYRISNFLLWQAAYSELYITETYWPDFDEKELRKAIDQFGSRSRRFGGV